LNDPTRADAVAAVGEVTGSFALSNMKMMMQNDEVGKRVLRERPFVDEKIAQRAFDLLTLHNQQNSSKANNNTSQSMSFGAAYATFLQTHNFDPTERTPVRFLSDPELCYVMTRYRQCHDYFHVLTGLPPTVLGELALKWLELMQTGLPLAALSATGGSLRLGAQEREVLWNVYYPWAVRVGREMNGGGLMCVYYEEEMETELNVLRERIGVEPAPVVEGF
jgi:ubiquinone biosynthesis protein COQ4